jgi:hypothetical protein
MVLNYTYFAISERLFEAGLIESAGVRDNLLAAKEASGASCARARFRGILAINY